MPDPMSTVLVTGASGGIGAALAREYARHRHALVLVARSRGTLESIAEELRAAHSVDVRTFVLDLATPGAADRLVAELDAVGIQVDVLVNNAGFALYGAFAETDWAKESEMLQLNVVTLTALTKRLLPGMLARRRGRILNLASTAGFLPGPLMAVYYATKAYVLSFSEALAEELRGSGVTVTALCPGPTRTGFQARAGMEASRLVSGKRLPDAAEVAREGYEGAERGATVVIPGLQNRLQVGLIRFLPRSMVSRIVHKAQERVQE
ncbi:MAG TPA: SDR family oxidoreductase [Myxococcaceae bacterium]|nr:SDR family oxidoreductase [Myxococcaceae bacterium]